MAAASRRHRPGGPPQPPARICPVIAGPTAVGKTDLITTLADEFPIEVISLDSRQVYHGLRIGTAQPSAEEQVRCRHHLVDFLSPDESYSAQRFRRDFTACWQEITGRGRLPILVGGAGLYLKAVEEGFLALPEGSEARLPALRREVDALSDEQLEHELAAVDPVTAQRLHPNDRYRRSRALEICRLTGKPFSELTTRQHPDPALGLRFPLVLLDRPVAHLDARIRTRTHIMLSDGWIDEVRGLMRHHDPAGPGLKSIGYAEIVRHLSGGLAERDLDAAIVTVTRQYAKRQRTWFRPRPHLVAGSPDHDTVLTALRTVVADALAALER